MNRDAQKYDWQPADKLDISLHGRKDTFGDFSIVGAVPTPLSASEPRRVTRVDSAASIAVSLQQHGSSKINDIT